MPFISTKNFHSVFWYARGISFYFSPRRFKSSWDPSVSLTFRHPTLLLLEKCSSNEHFKQILANMIRLHLTNQIFPMSRLLYFSALSHPENLNEAILLFNHLTPHRNLYIYRIMISALSFSSSQSIDLYKSMLWSGICPDEHTLISLLKSSKYLLAGKQIHGHAIVGGFTAHGYLQNSLMKMYLENEEIDLAQEVFRFLPKRDIVSYNIMISGYSGNGYVLQALEMFQDAIFTMIIEPDQFTMVALLMCCRQLKNALLGKSIHGWVIRRYSNCSMSLVLSNALLDMYTKCEDMKNALRVFNGLEEKDNFSWNIIITGFANIGELDLAFKFFSETPNKDLVTWNCILAGYARKGDCSAVMNIFKDMLVGNVKPDKVTAITLVCVAAEMGGLYQGRCTHGWVIKAHGNSDAFLGSAIIDMYCKCGSIEKALVAFEMISHRDITVWTAMIAGLAFHGHGIKALELFWKCKNKVSCQILSLWLLFLLLVTMLG